ncbi:protein ANKUB1-like [Osmerus mordax]|uniref:protein ANKUB1-like n=1 Tax=Osmerus mordax TaxID=8014 RepID=UPI00350EC4EF
MRVFIAFEGSCEPFDVLPDQTIGTMKQMVKDYFHVQLSDDKQVRHFLVLSYAGATLQDTWTLIDVGVTPGSAIRCLIKKEDKPVVRVLHGVTGETMSIMSTVFLLSSSVAKIKSLVSLKCDLPVGAFRLSTPSGVQLYDCNRLHDYAIEVGATLRLDTWDGWAEFLRGCLMGHKTTVQRHLSKERPVMRFQLRVALYVAASLGHLDLADWVLERGVRSEEPVGVHPYRQWCHQTAHPDATKCPVHVASERGQLLILKLFISSSVLTLSCRNSHGQDPLQIAIRHGHKECVLHLVTKLCSVMSLPGLSLPMRLYLQIKRWVELGHRRVTTRRGKGQWGPLRARVGDTVLVDGFTHPKMSSKPKRRVVRARRDVRPKASQYLTPNSCFTPASHLHPMTAFKGSRLQLPKLPLMSAGQANVKRMGVKRMHGEKVLEVAEDKVLDEVLDESSSQWKSRVPLPPVSRDTNPRPLFISASPNSSQILTNSLESFSRHCGRTPRENAIYCLAMASAFTERPWLQQLDVARTLARRSVQNMSYKTDPLL